MSSKSPKRKNKIEVERKINADGSLDTSYVVKTFNIINESEDALLKEAL